MRVQTHLLVPVTPSCCCSQIHSSWDEFERPISIALENRSFIQPFSAPRSGCQRVKFRPLSASSSGVPISSLLTPPAPTSTSAISSLDPAYDPSFSLVGKYLSIFLHRPAVADAFWPAEALSFFTWPAQPPPSTNTNPSHFRCSSSHPSLLLHPQQKEVSNIPMRPLHLLSVLLLPSLAYSASYSPPNPFFSPDLANALTVASSSALEILLSFYVTDAAGVYNQVETPWHESGQIWTLYMDYLKWSGRGEFSATVAQAVTNSSYGELQ